MRKGSLLYRGWSIYTPTSVSRAVRTPRQSNQDAVLLRSARIGQEFVIDLPAQGPHHDWLAALIASEP
jgi:hypothetical protein